MFFEDTNFDSTPNQEPGNVFNVINKVMKDDKKKVNEKDKKNKSVRCRDNSRENQIHSFNDQQLNHLISNQSNSPFNQDFSQEFNNNVLQSNFGLMDNTRTLSNMNFNPFQPNDSFKSLDHVNTISHNLNNLNSPSNLSSPHNFANNLFTFSPFHQSFNSNHFNSTTQKTLSRQSSDQQKTTTSNLSARIWHERPIPDIHTLHPELWAIIFTHLTIKDKGRVARTCVFFRDVVYSKSVWKGEIARLHLKKRHSVVLESLTRRGIKRIQILSLQRGLKEISQYMPNLKDLILTGCFHLTDEKVIAALTNKLSNLHELSLSMCKHITDNAIIHISEHLTSLVKLDVSGCPNITDQSLIALIKGLKQLKSLNLRSCRNITHKGLAYICGYKPPEGTASEEDQMEVDSDQELAIALDMEQPKVDLNSALVNLEELILQDCQKLNDDVLRYVPLGLSQLKSINLSFCFGITEFGLKNLTNHPSLESINLCHCNNVGDVGLRYLSEANLSKLISLDVSFCDKVNDQALSYIAQGLKELQVLSLNTCSITDNGLIKIGQNLTKLTTLNVGQCTKITDKSLFVVIENCVNLQSIDLYGCSRISTVSVEKLSRLPKLNKLNLNLKSQERDEKNEQEQSNQSNEPMNEQIFNQPMSLDKMVDDNNNVQPNMLAQNWFKDPYQLAIYERELTTAIHAYHQASSVSRDAFNYNGYFIPFSINFQSPFLYLPPSFNQQVFNNQLNLLANSMNPINAINNQRNSQKNIQPLHPILQSLASNIYFKYKNI